MSTAGAVFRNDRYTSPEFLRLELDHVFRRTWRVIAREADVPNRGDCLPVDELGESLIVVRGDDGEIRTFHNACRHRGTRLVGDRCHASQIRCPYHGWAYGLDGKLLTVPGADGFPGLDKASRGLSSVRTDCWGGFVWITFDEALPPLRDYLGALGEKFEPYRLSEMRPLLRRTMTLPCNWKAVLDQATESYHVRSVHGRSIGPQIKTTAAFHGLDPHHLQTVPIADYAWRARLDAWSMPPDLEVTPDQRRLFHKCIVFPNTLMNVMPYHLTVFRVVPLTADTCRFTYEFHIREHAGLLARARGALTLLASLYILREDMGILRPFQTGVNVAGDQTIAFHSEERPLAYFHAVIDRHIASGLERTTGAKGESPRERLA